MNEAISRSRFERDGLGRPGRHAASVTYALATLAVLLAVLVGAVAVRAQAGYDLTWNTVDGGGVSYASGGGYTLGGTAGQPDAAVWTGSTGYTLSGGFWHASADGGTPPGGETEVYLPLIVKP